MYRYEKRRVSLDDVWCDECPVSFITPRSRALIEMFVKASLAHQATGAALFGPDLSEWPVWAYDAAIVVQEEQNRVERALLARPEDS